MVKNICFIGLLLVAVSLCGCRCRSCNQSFFNPLAGFGSPRVAPPGTYTYQQNQQPNPYYNQSATANLPNYGLPANNGQQNNQSDPNWRPVGNQNGTTNPQGQPFSFAPPAGYPTNYTTLASNSTGIRSTDYRTTRVNEQMDPTRMPVSDASGVRAPARFVPNTNVAFAQNQPVQIRGQVQYQAQPRLYSVPNGVLANASTANYGQGTAYAAQPYVNGMNSNAMQANWQASGQNFSR